MICVKKESKTTLLEWNLMITLQKLEPGVGQSSILTDKEDPFFTCILTLNPSDLLPIPKTWNLSKKMSMQYQCEQRLK